MTSEPEQGLDFGPRGYLPRRAAQRARKIVLREQMGLGWPLAAVAAAVLVAVVGAVFLLTRATPPAPPFVPVAPIDAVDPAGATAFDVAGAPFDVLVVRIGGGLRTFAAPEEPVVYCTASRRLESPERVWNLRGRLVGGEGESLRVLTALLHEGVVYVDPSPAAAPPPVPAGETPGCVD
ncbi:MAG TPA: hypothetical protein VM324_07170 [Egibacteraceae bacterium]|nr:hypothetical protein [Egibacteraceae bacterium]